MQIKLFNSPLLVQVDNADYPALSLHSWLLTRKRDKHYATAAVMFTSIAWSWAQRSSGSWITSTATGSTTSEATCAYARGRKTWATAGNTAMLQVNSRAFTTSETAAATSPRSAAVGAGPSSAGSLRRLMPPGPTTPRPERPLETLQRRISGSDKIFTATRARAGNRKQPVCSHPLRSQSSLVPRSAPTAKPSAALAH